MTRGEDCVSKGRDILRRAIRPTGKRTGGRRGQTAGSALVLVLLLIVALSVFLLSFATDAELELRYASVARKRRQCDALVQSGLAIASMLMEKQQEISPDAEADSGEDDDRWFEAARRLAKGQPLQGLVEDVGDGQVILSITPEPGRRNVNLLTDEDWERILENAGVPEDCWPMLIDSYGDWIDEDENARSDGAESEDYYEKLEQPYSAKNGPLDTVGELLLVRGFTESLLKGGPFDPSKMDQLANEQSGANRFGAHVDRFADTNLVTVSGIEDLLTTYGDGKVNIQSASQEVLMTLPGIDEIAAGAIIEERGDFDDPLSDDAREPYASVDDLYSRVDGLDPAAREMMTTSSSYFRVTVTGKVGAVERRVWGIVYSDKGGVRFLRWCEEP